MKRRTFLRALAAVAAAPFIRKIPGAHRLHMYAIDGLSVYAGDRILITGSSEGRNNGIYEVTNVGDTTITLDRDIEK